MRENSSDDSDDDISILMPKYDHKEDAKKEEEAIKSEEAERKKEEEREFKLLSESPVPSCNYI